MAGVSSLEKGGVSVPESRRNAHSSLPHQAARARKITQVAESLWCLKHTFKGEGRREAQSVTNLNTILLGFETPGVWLAICPGNLC